MHSTRRARTDDARLNKPARLTEAGSTRWRSRLWPLAIFGAALMIRLIYLWQSAANPTFTTPVMDSYDYDDLARALLDGHQPHTPLLWQPVFYPLFLAGVYKVAGGSILAARILQVALGALTCALTYMLGVRVIGRRAGILAGIIVALYGPLIFYDADLTATGWAAFCAVAFVLLFIRCAAGFQPVSDSRGPGSQPASASCKTSFRPVSLPASLALGACAALSILARPTFLPVVIAGALWLVYRACRNAKAGFSRLQTPKTKGSGEADPYVTGRSSLKVLAGGLAGFLTITVPLAACSYPRSGHSGLLPASGGINFYIGNNRNAAETIAARPGRDWRALEDLPARHGVHGDMWKQQRFYYAETARDVAHAPLGFVRGLAVKAVEFFTSRELPRSEDIYVFRRWSPLLSTLLWKIGGFGFPFGVLLPLALIGLIRHGRRIPAPFWFMLILHPAAIILVFNAARYRAPLIPIIAVIAAGGALTIAEALRNLRWTALAGYGAICALVVAASTLPGPFPMEQLNYDAELHLLLGNRYNHEQKLAPAIEQFKAGLQFDSNNPDLHANLAKALLALERLDEAIEHYAAAVRLRPGSALNHTLYGLALFQRGDFERAIEEYRRALEIEPGYGKVWSQLGVALEQSGRLDEAIDAYRKGVHASPNEVIIHYNLGAALAKRGQLESALNALQAALAVDANYIEARYELALVLQRLGRNAEAAAALRDVLARQPDHAAARRLLSQIRGETPRRP